MLLRELTSLFLNCKYRIIIYYFEFKVYAATLITSQSINDLNTNILMHYFVNL